MQPDSVLVHAGVKRSHKTLTLTDASRLGALRCDFFPLLCFLHCCLITPMPPAAGRRIGDDFVDDSDSDVSITGLDDDHNKTKGKGKGKAVDKRKKDKGKGKAKAN